MRKVKFGRTPNAVANEQRTAGSSRGLQSQSEKSSTYRLNEEVETGETWIDGSSIYRYVYDVSRLPNATTKNFPVTFSYSRIVRMYGTAQAVDNIIPIPFVSSGSDYLEFWIHNGQLELQSGGNLSAYSWAYVVLEYVK